MDDPRFANTSLSTLALLQQQQQQAEPLVVGSGVATDRLSSLGHLSGGASALLWGNGLYHKSSGAAALGVGAGSLGSGGAIGPGGLGAREHIYANASSSAAAGIVGLGGIGRLGSSLNTRAGGLGFGHQSSAALGGSFHPGVGVTGLLTPDGLLRTSSGLGSMGSTALLGENTVAQGLPNLPAGMLSEDQILRLVGLDGGKKKRGKGSRQKKPKDMPKRPLSAYNIFFKEERASILNGIPSPMDSSGKKEPGQCDDAQRDMKEKKLLSSTDRKRQHVPHGKIGFENLAKTIGRRWRSLSTERHAHYKALADKDMCRYKQEMDDYHRDQAQKHKLKEKAKKEEKPNLKNDEKVSPAMSSFDKTKQDRKKDKLLDLQMQNALLAMERKRTLEDAGLLNPMLVGTSFSESTSLGGHDPVTGIYLDRLKRPRLSQDLAGVHAKYAGKLVQQEQLTGSSLNMMAQQTQLAYLRKLRDHQGL
eukprot:CAMPEP_0183293372 /NCGR_PEP_ID=MMETSP0160_2-20130417/2076_1 /TAXON_ID=2839 ORGANISM="Odontella Sinensis, Strain Grunow 1884" /NCGR_SAMPLE_ID=MMETSP0160_2 /ASSEMBLY_ACC=CAM_ASM_000250 /LENGTH=475 /DNA_ID=CAMNT_0025454475 /DNA_START=171 /DNA_END=1598 /DNA_ORIENTATION=-